jgi:hypothetical protein
MLSKMRTQADNATSRQSDLVKVGLLLWPVGHQATGCAQAEGVTSPLPPVRHHMHLTV